MSRCKADASFERWPIIGIAIFASTSSRTSTGPGMNNFFRMVYPPITNRIGLIDRDSIMSQSLANATVSLILSENVNKELALRIVRNAKASIYAPFTCHAANFEAAAPDFDAHYRRPSIARRIQPNNRTNRGAVVQGFKPSHGYTSANSSINAFNRLFSARKPPM